MSTGVPTVMVVLSGRPYAIGWAIDGPAAPAAVLQAFFPAKRAARRSPRSSRAARRPSGRLPVSLPRSAGAQPYTYLHPILGGPSEITSADSSPALPFGHGLTYTTFEHTRLTAPVESATSADFTVTVDVANTGPRAGVDVVQLYARDVYASVTRPVAQLVGYARVALEAGERTVVRFEVPSARLAFADRRGIRIVEPGDIELWVGGSCDERETRATMRLSGAAHEVTAADRPNRRRSRWQRRCARSAGPSCRSTLSTADPRGHGAPAGDADMVEASVTEGLPCPSPPEPPTIRSPLQEKANDHLWMHFARQSVMTEGDGVPIIVRGEGHHIWDASGKRYIDGLSGLFVVNAGHGRRRLAEVAAKQAEELAFFPIWSYAHPAAIELAERLADYAPGDLNHVFFSTGGGEAVETAFKLAKHYWKLQGKPSKHKVISRVDRVPRHPAGRARDHRPPRHEVDVRAGHPRRIPGAQHEPLPRRRMGFVWSGRATSSRSSACGRPTASRR